MNSDAIIFDLDGTLVDTLPDLTATLNDALFEIGLGKIDDNLVRSSLHRGFEESARAALSALGQDEKLLGQLVEAYQAYYRQAPATHSRLYPGVRDLLIRQMGRGVPMAVCTNKSESLALGLLDELDLRKFFSVVVGADTCARRKPDPEPLIHAIDRLDTPHDRAVLVGDSQVDVDCARSAHVSCLYFTGGYGTRSAQSSALEISFDAYSELMTQAANC